MSNNREPGKHTRSTMALNSQTLRWREGSVLKKALAALPETWGWLLAVTWRFQSSHNSSSRGSGALFWPLEVLHTQDNILVDTLIDKQKQSLKRTRQSTDKCTLHVFSCTIHSVAKI